MRALNYPPQSEAQPPPKGSLRCSAHSDYGTLTLLRQDGVGGLQLDVDGRGTWADVVSDEYDFIVNIGNTLKLWTNDKFKSTRHRVVNGRNDRERGRRQSIAFFHNPNGDAKIETIASCRDEEGGSRYQPVVFRDFLNELHHGSQTNYEREGGEQGNCEADEAG
jgi:isopenicillin N synthase-like dioxygenase